MEVTRLPETRPDREPPKNPAKRPVAAPPAPKPDAEVAADPERPAAKDGHIDVTV